MTHQWPDDDSLPLNELKQIDRVCLDFESAWQNAQRPRIEDHLESYRGQDRERLFRELLLLELDYRRADADPPTVSEYESRFPDQATVVDRVFREQQSGGDSARPTTVATAAQSTSVDSQDAATPQPSRSDLRFDILRSYAKGGLGEVFVAYDRDLNRQVAVKEIQTRHARNETGRARFTFEAEVTGGLEHPGVVPVYACGAYADGRPFYAMRLIRGESLQQAARKFHENRTTAPCERDIEFRKLLGRLIAVCQTIEYAHSRGVLHRDLKPANIMLGKYGETLVVDWGLAKATGSAEGTELNEEQHLNPRREVSGSADTATGAALGTPSYMSPEQAAGRLENVGPASDVYSLGATLYVMLTGQAPFRSGNTADVIRQVREGDFQSPRTVNPRTPRSLDAICLKAMAREPENRYPSAAALADDLEAWLAEEPVSAHREPILDRIRRWGRHHRTSVLVTLAVVIVVLLGTAVGNVLLAAKNRDLRAANARAEIAKGQAEQRFDLAMRAVEDYYTGISREVVLSQPGFTNLRQSLLRKPLLFYDELRESLEKEQTPQSRAALADAYLGIGTVDSLTGSSEKAAASFQKAIDLFHELVRQHPDVPKYQVGLARSHAKLGTLERDLSQSHEALQSVLSAIETTSQLVRAHPNVPEFQGRLAHYHNLVGSLQTDCGKPQDAITSFRSAAEIAHELVRAADDANYRSVLAGAYEHIGLFYKNAKDLNTAVKYYKMAEANHLELFNRAPNNSSYQLELADLYNNLSYLRRAMKQPEKALEECLKSGRFREKVANDYPNVPSYQEGVAIYRHLLGNMQREVGQQQEARLSYRQAIDVLEKLGERHPQVPAYQDQIADNHQNLGSLQRDLGDKGAAIESYRTAVKIRDQLATQKPESVDFQRARIRLIGGFGHVLDDFGERSEALEQHQTAIEILEDLTRKYPAVVGYKSDQIQCLRNYGKLQFAMRQDVDAKDSYEKALQICRELVGKYPEMPKHQSDTAKTLNDLGNVQRSSRQLDDAVTYYEEAIHLSEDLVAKYPDVVAYQDELAVHCHDLAICHQRRRDFDAAVASCERAVRWRSELAKSGAPAFIHDCAYNLNFLGVLHRENGNTPEAIHGAIEQAIEIEESISHDEEHRDAVFLAGCYCNRGNFILESGDAEAALKSYDIAMNRLESIVKPDPQNTKARKYAYNTIVGRVKALIRAERYDETISQCDKGIALAYGPTVPLHLFRQQAFALKGDHRGATREAELFIKETPLKGPAPYDLACLFCLSARAAKNDIALSDDDRKKLTDQYAARAMDLLEKARELGYFSQPSAVSRLSEDPDLDPIRKRKEFQLFSQQVSKIPDGA